MTKGGAYSQPGWAGRALPCRAAGSLCLKDSDTWSEIKGGAGKKMEIFDSFSEIPVQTTWTASRRVCLAVKWATHSANENYIQSFCIFAFLCSDYLVNRWQLQGFLATVVWQALLQEWQAWGWGSRWTIYGSLVIAEWGALMQAWSWSWLQSLGGGWVWKKAVCGRSAGTKICIQLSHGTLGQVLNIASVWTWTICYRRFSDWRKTRWSLSPCVNSAEEREIQRTGKQAVLALSFAKCKAIFCLNWHKLGVIPLQPTDGTGEKQRTQQKNQGYPVPVTFMN